MALTYTVVSGSHRENSQSSKVSKTVQAILRRQNQGSEIFSIDLRGNPLPLWDESFFKKDPKWEKLWTPYATMLRKSDAVVIVTPEWHGTVPAGLKNFFHLGS